MRLREKIKVKVITNTIWFFLLGLAKDGNNLRKRLLYYKLGKELDKKENKKMIEGLRGKMKGKKTYLIAISGILGAVIAWLNGNIEAAEMIKLSIEAMVAMSIRAGISKSNGGGK